MTQKTIAPIVLALVLGALPASAASRFHDEDRRNDRETHRAQQATQEGRIQVLAVRLDQATSQLFDEAVESKRQTARREQRLSWRERRALHAVRRLEQQADRFHARVERYGASDRRTDGAFQELQRAHQLAVACQDDLRRPRKLRREFERVGELMGKLDRRIAQLDRHPKPRRHASHRDDEDRRRQRWQRDPFLAFLFGF